MDQLFELSASIVLDTAGFISAVEAAEQRAQALQQRLTHAADAASAAMRALQQTAAQAWQGIAGSIAAATHALETFAAVQGSTGVGVPAGREAPGFATGLNYVPHDDFTARLHQGEAVLTRLEAAEWRARRTPAPAIDYNLMAEAMLTAFSGVSLQMDKRVVGGLVGPTVSRDIARGARNRRYTG